MGEPVCCALTRTPSMAPSWEDVTRPVSAKSGVSNNSSAKAPFAGNSVLNSTPTRHPAKALRAALIPMERYACWQLRLDHQAIDFDRGRRVAARRLPPHCPLQLEAILAAGDLYVLRIDVLAETGKFEMTLIVGAGHKAGIAVLDFG